MSSMRCITCSLKSWIYFLNKCTVSICNSVNMLVKLNNTLKYSDELKELLLPNKNRLFECHQQHHVHVCQLTFTRDIWIFIVCEQTESRIQDWWPGRISIGILRIQLGIELLKGINTCRAVKAHGGCTDSHTGRNYLRVSEDITVQQNYLMPSLNIQWPSYFHVGKSTAV